MIGASPRRITWPPIHFTCVESCCSALLLTYSVLPKDVITLILATCTVALIDGLGQAAGGFGLIFCSLALSISLERQFHLVL